MREFEKRYKKYKTIRTKLSNACIEFIKEVATAWDGNVFPLSDISNEFDVDDAYCYIVYDGGRHPEYASNAFSKVEGIFIDKKGNLTLSIEDCDKYDIERVDEQDLDSVAYALSAAIDYMVEDLIELIGGEFTHKKGLWTLSRDTWDKLVDLAEGRDDISNYIDDDLDETTKLQLADCYNPKGYVNLIKSVAQIGENEVVFEWK
jgi:hypothetical protein